MQKLDPDRLRVEAAMQPKPKITSAMANAEAMGLVRGTPAYNDFINPVEAGGTKILGGDKQKELAYKAALTLAASCRNKLDKTESLRHGLRRLLIF